ncbi:MAG: DUF5996 family protein [Paracoccaceae bacterium]|nr:DUF5996 family protein [Paracoccaceae bacterium]
MTDTAPPPLPYADWVGTRDTLHLFLQIIGKIRLKSHPKLNHWWHVTLYPYVHGVTTGRIPYGDIGFEITYNMIYHYVMVSRNDGRHTRFDAAGRTVAEFYNATMKSLDDLGITVKIHPVPYENKSTVPFPDDTALRAYDKAAVTDYRKALCQIASTFEVFRTRFNGKQTPVHLYWHSFDLVVTRFSGRAHALQGGTPSDREAYSHEVISIGFWPGDDTFPKAAFYGYAYPEPAGLNATPLAPGAAQWVERNGGALAVLEYDAFRQAKNPADDLLAFLESVYQNAGQLADWDIRSFEHAPD